MLQRHEAELAAVTAVASEQKKITASEEKIAASWATIGVHVKALRELGWPPAQIATTLGISANRVTELTREPGKDADRDASDPAEASAPAAE
jgi:hypothetical protein